MKNLIILIVICILVSCGRAQKEVKEYSNQVELTSMSLQGKSLEKLRVKRNEIFARKGYKFKSENLQKHFSTFDWYKPRYDHVDSLLTAVDKMNIATILKAENRIKKSRKLIQISKADFLKYETAFKTAGKWEKEFIKRLFWTIDNYKGREADTTILTIGNIDGIGSLDTVQNHIYVLDDTTYVESKWFREGKLLWRGDMKNPYLGINDDDIFSYDLRNPWVTFTIAVHYCEPVLSHRDDYSGIDREVGLKMAKWYIERKNLQILESDYIEYFDSFKGQLFIYGEPEIRYELLQWYEPKKKFILYYAP